MMMEAAGIEPASAAVPRWKKSEAIAGKEVELG